MSHTVSSTQPISSAHTVKRYAGFGIQGANIPASGDQGGSPVLNDSVNPASEYYWRIETPAGSGTVTIYPDLSFEHTGAADGTWPWVYRLYWVDADGTTGNGTATVTDIFGSGSVALVVSDASHGHAADAVSLSTQWMLAIAEALHAHASDNFGLSTSGSTSLSVADGTHAQLADPLALSVQWVIAIADGQHAHVADNEILDTSNAIWLNLQESQHAHLSDGVALSAQAALSIFEAIHAHTGDALMLGLGQSSIQILDASHVLKSDAIYLSLPGGALSVDTDFIIKAPKRRLIIYLSR